MLFRKKKDNLEEIRKIVVSGENVSGRIIEGYNRLKDNILYMGADGKYKVIQVESSNAGEGKTTTACNLAVSLGQTNKKVVVVDLDFHKPKAHTVFNLSKENGISEFMLGKATIKDITKKTDYENVDFISGGGKVHNSSLILVSEVFKDFIATLRNEYDYVILDCAPILSISDYIHISKVSDGVLFVCAYARTTKGHVAEAIKELRRNGVHILGSVFSMYDKKRDRGDYYKYYYYNDTDVTPPPRKLRKLMKNQSNNID